MGNSDILLLRCPAEACGKQFKMYRPTKGGIFKITCPHCSGSFKMRVPEPEVKEVTPTSAVPDNSALKPVRLEGDFVVGDSYEILCPHCQSAKMRYTPQEAGVKGFRCPSCKGVVAVQVRDKTKVIDVDDTGLVKGRLRQLATFGKGKTFPLPVGKKLMIGRSDKDNPSDISIKDSYVSRRSLSIEVLQSEEGYSFRLSVLNARNPVTINGERLSVGDSVYLGFGDIIGLGQTKLTLEKDS